MGEASTARWATGAGGPVEEVRGWPERPPRLDGRASGGGGWYSPACEVIEREQEIVLRFDVPGVDPDRDLEVAVEAEVLVVRGERRLTLETETGSPVQSEVPFGRFERRFALPAGVDDMHVRAHYDLGVLEVGFPKGGAAESKRVPIVHVATGAESIVLRSLA